MSHPARSLARRMNARDPHESHRVATPLELLFDLCFVGAVAQAAAHLHHGVAAGHGGAAIMAYGMVFFAIWWAWMNFTWFASAYDVDDVPYRLKVLLQIAGGLVLAAGVPRAFEQHDFKWVTFGYTIMRVGLIAGWLRAARDDVPRRRTGLRYAAGVTLCQIGWLSLLVVPGAWWMLGWPVLVTAEMLVPMWAERAGATAWHPHHIAERYGCFTLIVLGESVLGSTVALQTGAEQGALSAAWLGLVGGGVLIIFSMWWLYFDQPAHRLLVSNRAAFLWGYGHLLIFASTAAVGAGLCVASDVLFGEVHLGGPLPGAAVAVPVALYVLIVWVLHVRPQRRSGAVTVAYLMAVPLILTAAFSAWTVLGVGLILVAVVTVSVWAGNDRD